MFTTSKTTFELLYGICYWYALKCFIHCWYVSKCSICHWYAPEHFIRHWYALITLCSICYELICSEMSYLPLICSNYSVPHLLWTDMFWNILSAIDMLQLLYAPFVMNQICFEWHDTYDFVSNEMVSLRILVFCFTLWYLTRLKSFLLFWICFVTCWAVFGSLRCYINLSGQRCWISYFDDETTWYMI